MPDEVESGGESGHDSEENGACNMKDCRSLCRYGCCTGVGIARRGGDGKSRGLGGKRDTTRTERTQYEAAGKNSSNIDDDHRYFISSLR